MSISEAVTLVEAAGAIFRVDGDKVRISYVDGAQRNRLVPYVAFLRDHRAEAVAFLGRRVCAVPAMPEGVSLLTWNLKEPPLQLEPFLVVTDPTGFAKAALRELRERLSNPKRKHGRPVAQLLDHLAGVGVLVNLGADIEGGVSKS